MQLERLAQQFAPRDQFLAELALDPPAATGDNVSTPYLDEDYLILSTVHSAKDRNGKRLHPQRSRRQLSVRVLHGTIDQIEEERRLLYVAMTRAKNDLHLIAPLKYDVTNQPKYGDRHVYGARSRFLTKSVMATFSTRLRGPTLTIDPTRPHPATPGSTSRGSSAECGRP